MNDWDSATLEEVSLRITKGTTPTSIGGEFSETGISFVKVESIAPGGVIDKAKLAFITDSTNDLLRRSVLQSDDILFSIAGTIGRVARVTPDLLPANTNQALAIIRPNPERVDVRFLMYSLRDAARVQSATSRVVQSVQANLSLSQLSEVEIALPPLDEQRAIAEVLGALDDKIAANTSLARTVDAYLYALLESFIEDSTDESPLVDIADVNAITLKPKRDGQLRYIDIASVKVGWHETPNVSKWIDAPSRARRGVRKGDTLWSTVRPNRRSHSLNLAVDPSLVASTGLAVLSPRDVGFAYLYELTRRPEFTAQLENVAEGSAYPAVRADRFRAVAVPMLPERTRQDFEEIAGPLREHIHSLTLENDSLVSIRDALLSHLVTGKLRVKDAKAFVPKGHIQ